MTRQTMPSGATEGRVADAVRGNWVDRHAPPAARPYLRLSRADRPIGTWLLLIPCWWGLLLAVAADPGGPRLFDLWIGVGCAAGAFLMRGAGCTWNDLTDRDIDAKVARTRSRPLPSGQVTRAAGGGLDGGAGAGRVRDPAELSAGGDRARGRLARARRRLSVRQAVHLVAAGVPRARLQLGRAARLGCACARPRRGAGAALCRRHRLDAVLRHDLRAPGPGGRRADRGEVDGTALRHAHEAMAARLSRSPRRGWPRRRCLPPALRARRARWRSPAWRGSGSTSSGSSGGSTSTTAPGAWRSSARTATRG